ncbi:esterase/lipase family protein [Xylanimonas oleitrophica]|uniref:esterase/lipase family protein n=1 Tax=Xylanimonas oleitrophica TaxID=2607479 RepID=UPI0015CFF5FD|nr:alpha/beta hydrolase [Xylanimonas oleitrophica]
MTASRLRAWAADYLWALDRQARALRRRRPLPSGPGGRAPVVLLPGVYETWEFLRPVATALAAAGHPVHPVRALRHNRRPVAEAAEVAAGYLEDADLHGAVLVAHSKGGLVGKHVMLSAAGTRVAGMVTVATPFAGSRWARYMVGRGLRSFSPDDPGLLALAAQDEVNPRITAVYPRFDPHIPQTVHLPGGRNVEVALDGHFRPLGQPALVRLVVAEVDRIEDASR